MVLAQTSQRKNILAHCTYMITPPNKITPLSRPSKGAGTLAPEDIMANSPAHLYSTYVKALNVGDVEATLARYESHASFVTRSGWIARGV